MFMRPEMSCCGDISLHLNDVPFRVIPAKTFVNRDRVSTYIRENKLHSLKGVSEVSRIILP